MKYNISNLDKFKNIEVKVSNLLSEEDIKNNLVEQISNYKHNLLEETIKELVKPHADIEKLNMLEIVNELAYKDLELKHLCYDEYDKYTVNCKRTDKEDYFLVRNKFEIKQEENIYKVVNYISDIIRGIE